jgi:hypothetical protein
MLEYELKQSERRGRFLIQEIEEEFELSSKNLYFCSDKNEKNTAVNNLFNANFNNMNNSKRPKHSSIIMDSKIVHTTRTDSNYNDTFFTFIYEENMKDWADFDKIWKEFSKVHVDVLEDDMEKIFHYIDIKIDDSDFFNIKHLNEPETNFHKFRSTDKIKSDNEHQIENKNNNPNFNENSRSDKKCKNTNRSFIFTNFGGPSIVSPMISPINSSFEEDENKDHKEHKDNKDNKDLKDPKDLKDNKSLCEFVRRKKSHTESEQKFTSKQKEEFIALTNSKKLTKCEDKLKFSKNINFTLLGIKKASNYLNFTINCNQIGYLNDSKIEEVMDPGKLCIVCKNKL